MPVKPEFLTSPRKAFSPEGREFVISPVLQLEKDLKLLKKRVGKFAKPIPFPVFPRTRYSLEAYQTPIRDQRGRGSCWAFAGIAALEAAYKRKYGVSLDLSEQYLFHMAKCVELYPDYVTSAVRHENNSSYWGAQGNAGIVETMTRLPVCEERFAPYLDQPDLDALKTQLPAAGNLDWESTQEQLDTFEFDFRNIPQEARHQCRYRVKSWGVLPTVTAQNIENVLLNNHEVVIDIDVYKWKYNATRNVYEFDPAGAGGGGHVVLIIGFDRDNQTFLVKNSWGGNQYLQLTYDYITRVSGQWFTGFYITDVDDIQAAPDLKSKWIGNWKMDHDGWRGSLTIRRFTSFHNTDPNAPTKLGNYYRDGKKFDVNGYFVDNGQGMVCYVADHEGRVVPGTLFVGQRFDTYNFSWAPRLGAGKTFWNNIPFGVVLNRDTFPHQPSNTFSRSEWLGQWHMNHDGWQGVLTLSNISSGVFGLLFVTGTYRASDGRTLSVSGLVNQAQQHVLSLSIPFSPTNNQPFELLYHTWEDKLFSGVTQWGGRKFGVVGQKA
ncbi:C1 family peptidase [Siphonobacter aquaeclarae]|uniref:Cysteine protease, C1A family n=1 Tax=Siphonobacter aquaeclarae TaxID=563176 RepID=A0A1G9L4B2_9BACT|nr:C1 family peptidase [Siphonobacter aquaeclarae]SDL56792.1 Cysteine protease, C1A family [Siphonobacter aquaeclarae]